MTPNLRLEQHQRFRTALRQQLSDAKHSILNKNQRIIKISDIRKEMQTQARGRLET